MPIQRLSRTALCALALAANALAQPPAEPARRPKPAPAAAVACDQTRAVALVQQQVAEARSFDNPVQQISVMARAADLLWDYQQDAARAVFTEAFELASKHYARKGDESRTEGAGLTRTLPDQRFVVMTAVARRDPEWARRLAEGVAAEARAAAEKAAAGAGALSETGVKLIALALALLPVDKSSSVALARNSFRSPLTLQHPQFFFKLAELDPAAADALAAEAVGAYSRQGTTEDFSYLSIYVFGLRRNISRVRAWTSYQPPQGLVPSRALQEAFVKAVLARAELISKSPEQFSVGKSADMWETSQVYSALVSLEPLVAQSLPAYSERLAAARASALAALNERSRQSAEGYLDSLKEWEKYGRFDVMLEEAERETRPEMRDYAITRVVMAAKKSDDLARLESLAERVGDAGARRQLFDWINFNRAQGLAREGLLDEAKRAADRVGELDHRAILYFEIAREGIKNLDDRARASALLDEVLAAAAKAPVTAARARTQLGVAHLFAEFDGLRSLEVLADAVKTINQLDNPDVSSSGIFRRIEGKDFGVYGSYNVTGFTIENAFREAGPHDFEGALLTARNLSDRGLRATAVVGLAAHCLEQSAKPKPQPKPAKRERP